MFLKNKSVSTDIHLVQIPTPAGPVTVPLPHPFQALNVMKYVSMSKMSMLKRAVSPRRMKVELKK
jgi:hypothetical protein